MKKINILIVGKISGRLSCLVDTLDNSNLRKELHVSTNYFNSTIVEKASILLDDSDTNYKTVQYAKNHNFDFCIISDESALANGLVDRLLYHKIPVVGPTPELARIETSKIFSRNLISTRFPELNPKHRVFHNIKGLDDYLQSIDEFVIKPDGLTGGKGVWVMGDHFHTINEALQYSSVLLNSRKGIIIEEKLYGKEFSLMSFSDGNTVVDMPLVRDYKRSGIGNTGSNSGGMGSYSCADHRLPDIDQNTLNKASYTNKKVIEHLQWTNGMQYKGILYGNYIKCTDGSLKIIEFNARFGDPEVMNVLPIMKTDFIEVCQAIISGTLESTSIKFKNRSTVCKYIVPRGYPDDPVSGVPIDISKIITSPDIKVFHAGIETINDIQIMRGSRALAIVGIGPNKDNTLGIAENIAENTINNVYGDIYHRSDIGVMGKDHR